MSCTDEILGKDKVRVGAPFRRRAIFSVLRTRRMVDAPTR